MPHVLINLFEQGLYNEVKKCIRLRHSHSMRLAVNKARQGFVRLGTRSEAYKGQVVPCGMLSEEEPSSRVIIVGLK